MRPLQSPPVDMRSRHHTLDGPLALVVFLGGCLGTGCRYLLAGLPGIGGSAIISTGTFAANMTACCGYAALTAYLAQARWTPERRRELTGRGCGMGLCGGLSTSSTLSVEIVVTMRSGRIVNALLYMLITVILGLVVAFIGARLGSAAAVRRSTRLKDDHRAKAGESS